MDHLSETAIGAAETAEAKAAARALLPADEAQFLDAAVVLGDAGFFAAVDAVLIEGRARFPGSAAVAKAYTKSMLSQGHAEAAAARFDAVAAIFSNAAPMQREALAIIFEISDALTRQGNLAAASEFLEEQVLRFPDSVDLAIRYGMILNKRRLWDEAARRWAILLARFPDNLQMLGGQAEALWGMKDESALVPALDRLLLLQPHNITAEILYARLEMRHNRAADAVARLVAAEARWPGNKNLRAQLNDARLQAMAASDDAAVDTAVTSAPTQMDNETEEAKLFAGFESLGSGCEFGLLQRRFGIEPIGLLRWANITPRGLIDAMERRFEGIGEAATTQLKVMGENYVLMDSVYELGMQTFIYAGTEAAETLLPKLCSRQRYLARALMDDMEDGLRILVYKMTEKMSGDDIRRLWRAVRAYGDNALLLVQLADAEHPAGSLTKIEDGLMVGALAHYSNHDIAVGDWTKVCAAARDAWEAVRARR
jgi:hypothetical protein